MELHGTGQRDGSPPFMLLNLYANPSPSPPSSPFWLKRRRLSRWLSLQVITDVEHDKCMTMFFLILVTWGFNTMPNFPGTTVEFVRGRYGPPMEHQNADTRNRTYAQVPKGAHHFHVLAIPIEMALPWN